MSIHGFGTIPQFTASGRFACDVSDPYAKRLTTESREPAANGSKF